MAVNDAVELHRAGFVKRLKSIVKYISEIEIALIKVFLFLGTLLSLSKWLWSEIARFLR